MLLSLPHGASRILESRMKGEKPSDLVIVSLVGPVDEGNPVVLANGPEHDWRFCRGLHVCIFGKVGTPNRQTGLAIGSNIPSRLYLWDVEAKEGTELIVHLRESALKKRAGEFKTSDWAAILWPWSDWQNRTFQEVRV